MSTSQMSDEEALETAWDAGYEEGAADALDEALDEDHIEDWIDELRKSGINVLEWFQVRWDAAEKRVVVEQQSINNDLKPFLEPKFEGIFDKVVDVISQIDQEQKGVK